MKSLKAYDIEIFRLANGLHPFEYEINNSFFSSLEDSIIETGNLQAKITIDKSERLVVAEFQIVGEVKLVCDRSLEEYNFPINRTDKIVFKFGDAYEELSEDVVSIPRDLQRLNMAQFIYEFIGLSIPMKKLHPRFKEEDSEEEGEIIYRSGSEEEAEEKEIADPRWEALKNLKNKIK